MDVSTVYFPSAIALGALHALEPGHAKTLTAAYLIGTKGTKFDAVLLGLSVAFTHSIVVVGLSVGAVMFGREAFTDDVSRWLAIVSGALVVVLGFWLLRKRLRVIRRAVHVHSHEHSHAPDPQPINGRIASGIVEIVDTPMGECLRLTLQSPASELSASVRIHRGGGKTEILSLAQQADASTWQSNVAPEEPHEFKAEVLLSQGEQSEAVPFEVHEPEHHHHHHHHDHSMTMPT